MVLLNKIFTIIMTPIFALFFYPIFIVLCLIDYSWPPFKDFVVDLFEYLFDVIEDSSCRRLKSKRKLGKMVEFVLFIFKNY